LKYSGLITKEQLEATISWANTWSGRSTLLLAVGILGEYAILPFLDEKKWWNKRAKYAFALFVLLGIVGEYGFSSKISQSAGELQRLSDGELTVAQSNAATASQKATDAETQLASMKVQASHAERDAATAKARQQGVEIELSQQREKTATAERALLEVRKRMEPRNLFASDVEKLRGLLANKPKSPVVVACVYGDQEGCAFASQIKRVLDMCGWDVTGVKPKVLDGNPAGLFIHVPSEGRDFPVTNTVPIGATVLNDAFAELGMTLKFSILPSLPTNTVELVVGYR
jgi:hypothetical protein